MSFTAWTVSFICISVPIIGSMVVMVAAVTAAAATGTDAVVPAAATKRVTKIITL